MHSAGRSSARQAAALGYCLSRSPMIMRSRCSASAGSVASSRAAQYDLSQSLGAERGVASAQFATYLARRILRHVAESSFIEQAFDIPIGQTADVGANHQSFQGSRAHDAAHVRDDPTHEAVDGPAHLRHGDTDLPLGGLDRFGPTPVPRASGGGPALVARPTQEGRDLVFNGTL